MTKIAEKTNIERHSISRYLKEENIQIKKQGSHIKKFNKKEELYILKLYIENDKSADYIAKEMNTTQSTVLRILNEFGVEIRPFWYYYTIKISEIDKDDIVNLYTKEKSSIKEISKKFNVSSTVISRILAEKNVKINTPGNYRKLSQKEEVDVIKLYIDKKKTFNEIGNIVGLSTSSVRDVLLRNNISYETHNSSPSIYWTLTEKDKDDIVSKYINDLCSAPEIAKISKLPERIVYEVLEKMNVKMRQPAQSRLCLTDMEFEEYLNNLPPFQKYRTEVMSITKGQDFMSLQNYEKRGQAGLEGAYHLDHMISIKYGFINKISPEVIGHMANLKMIPWKENILKYSSCSITLEELYSKINSQTSINQL